MISKKDLRSIVLSLSNRGKDSWGYVLVNDYTSDLTYEKFPSSIASYGSWKKIKLLRKKLKSARALLLHSRLSTSGFSGLPDHNHPIASGSTILVHNGLITKWPKSLDKIIRDDLTDSQNLAMVIDALESSVIHQTLNSIEGEITVVWYNLENRLFSGYTNVGNLYKTEFEGYTVYTSEPLKARCNSEKFSVNKVEHL